MGPRLRVLTFNTLFFGDVRPRLRMLGGILNRSMALAWATMACMRREFASR
jgi:hypothetical protein